VVADEVQPTSYPAATSWAKSVNASSMEMELIVIGRNPALTSRGFWSRISVANSGMYLPYVHVGLAHNQRWREEAFRLTAYDPPVMWKVFFWYWLKWSKNTARKMATSLAASSVVSYGALNNLPAPYLAIKGDSRPFLEFQSRRIQLQRAGRGRSCSSSWSMCIG